MLGAEEDELGRLTAAVRARMQQVDRALVEGDDALAVGLGRVLGVPGRGGDLDERAGLVDEMAQAGDGELAAAVRLPVERALERREGQLGRELGLPVAQAEKGLAVGADEDEGDRGRDRADERVEEAGRVVAREADRQPRLRSDGRQRRRGGDRVQEEVQVGGMDAVPLGPEQRDDAAAGERDGVEQVLCGQLAQRQVRRTLVCA